jgi:hypothetical protein
VKNALNYPVFGSLVCLLFAFILSDCAPFERPLREGDPRAKGVLKEVEVYTFKRVVAQAFNFELIPTMIAISDGVLYSADGDRAHLLSWDLKAGNQASAWVKLTGFKGRDLASHYDLNTGNRTITKLAAGQKGVLVALSHAAAGAPVHGKLGGIARFDGQLPQALWSRVFIEARADQDWPSKVLDLQETKNSDGILLSYAIVEFSPAGFAPSRHVLWTKSGSAAKGFYGVLADGAASLKFSGAVALPLPPDNKIGALSTLGDGRVVLAQPQGLLTIASESVGVTDAENPRLEQKMVNEVLDKGHGEQWRAGLALGTQITDIVAMRLVGERYLVVLAHDGAGKHSLKSADLSQYPWVFRTNLSAPLSHGSKIVVNGDEARIVSAEKIYRFKDGVFALELDSEKLSSDLAYLQEASETLRNPHPPKFGIETFKGGNLGDVPDDGTDFFDAAFYQSEWFYATDHGLYRVTKSRVEKAFSEQK